MDKASSARGDTEQNRIEFLDGELDLCQTFLDVAEIEVDDPEREALAKKNARQGYETALGWIGGVQSGGELERLSAKLARLKERLERSSA